MHHHAYYQASMPRGELIVLIIVAVAVAAFLFAFIESVLDDRKAARRRSQQRASVREERRAQTNVTGLGTGDVIRLPVRNETRPVA